MSLNSTNRVSTMSVILTSYNGFWTPLLEIPSKKRIFGAELCFELLFEIYITEKMKSVDVSNQKEAPWKR